MKTPTLPTGTSADRIVLIPEADRSRSGSLVGLMVMALMAAMLLAGGIVYASQQAQIRDRDLLVHAARVEAATSQDRAGATVAGVDALRAQVAELEATLAAQQADQTILQGQATQARGRAEQTQARLDSVQHRLRSVQASLDQMEARMAGVTGPPLPDGRHIAYVLAAGSAQSPPMIVVDVGRWFSGDAARSAAIADGSLAARRHLYQGRYLRNRDHGLRILPVRRGATFTIRPYDGIPGETSVTFSTLASILANPSFASARIAHDPFWIDVRHHRVASGHQQVYRAP